MLKFLISNWDFVLGVAGSVLAYLGVTKRLANNAEVKRLAGIAADAIVFMIEHNLLEPKAELILAKWRDRFNALLNKVGLSANKSLLAQAEAIVYDRLNSTAIDKGLSVMADAAKAIVKSFEKGK